jgi:hypothetical protein
MMHAATRMNDISECKCMQGRVPITKFIAGVELWDSERRRIALSQQAVPSSNHHAAQQQLLENWTALGTSPTVAFLTAFASAELVHRYPNAGTGSAYYFAEKAFLDREEPSHAVGHGYSNSSPAGRHTPLLGLPRCHGGFHGDFGHLHP